MAELFLIIGLMILGCGLGFMLAAVAAFSFLQTVLMVVACGLAGLVTGYGTLAMEGRWLRRNRSRLADCHAVKRNASSKTARVPASIHVPFKSRLNRFLNRSDSHAEHERSDPRSAMPFWSRFRIHAGQPPKSVAEIRRILMLIRRILRKTDDR